MGDRPVLRAAEPLDLFCANAGGVPVQRGGWLAEPLRGVGSGAAGRGVMRPPNGFPLQTPGGGFMPTAAAGKARRRSCGRRRPRRFVL